MTPEIRLEAIKIAHTLHTDIDAILASAGKLVHFVSGTDAPAAKVTKTAATKVSTEQTQPVTQPSTASAATPSATQTVAAQEPAASTAPKVTQYEPIKKLILKLIVGARTEVLAILQHHGVSKGPELKPEQYDSAHAQLTALDSKVEAAKAQS